eukprot:m.135968 g.135968  ORF g.135968 m.135968 type:complete len:1880 (+) comp16965_c1_seq4:890-6529(+)
MAEVVHSGPVHKRASKGLIKGWKKRWLRLDASGTLAWFADRDFKKQKGATSVVRVDDQVSVTRPNVFCVHGSDDSMWLFSGESPNDHLEWVKALKKAAQGSSDATAAGATSASVAPPEPEPTTAAEPPPTAAPAAATAAPAQEEPAAEPPQEPAPTKAEAKAQAKAEAKAQEQAKAQTKTETAAAKKPKKESTSAAKTKQAAPKAAPQPASSRPLNESSGLLKQPHPELEQFTVTPKDRLRGEPKTIRLFLSSTFVDTHGERDMIVKKVIPALNKDLADRDVQIVPVDLRWGVSAEESTPKTIQKTCLNEIDNCVTDPGERPWFLGLRSQRYGWVQEEFNAPEEFDHPEKFGWMEEVKQAHPHGISITSMEVWHAVLGNQSKGMQPHAFFAFRDPSISQNVESDWQWLFDFEYRPEDASLPDTVKMQYSKTKLYDAYRKDVDTITTQIRSANDKCVCFDYAPKGEVITRKTGQLDNGKLFGTGSVQDLDHFAQQVFSLLWTAIDKEYPAYSAPISQAALNDVQHELMARSRRANFVGRQSDLTALETYVTQPSTNALALVGAAGSGKSALLSQFCKNTEDKQIPIIKHFVGTNTDSFSLHGTLSRLCVGLSNYVKGGLWNYKAPTSAAKARSEFTRMLEMVDQQRKSSDRIVVVIDGLDQLRDEGDARKLGWLPSTLPEHVRVIISVAEGSDVVAKMRARAAKIPEQVLPPLTVDDAKQLVRSALDVYHKKLSEDPSDPRLGDQMALLMDKAASNQPLYLLAALTELVTFGVYEQVTPYLKSIPPQLAELVDFVFARLEKEHGEELVRVTLSTITVAVGGILETEMVEFLSNYEFKTKQVSDFSRLFHSIRMFVTAGGSGMLRIFHAPVEKVCRARYLARPEQVDEAIAALVEYDRRRADPLGDHSWRGDQKRAFQQLTVHMLLGQGPAALGQLLIQPAFLGAKARACPLRALLDDFNAAELDTLGCTVYAAVIKAGASVVDEPDQMLYQITARLADIDDADVSQFVAECRAQCPEYAPLGHGMVACVELTSEKLSAVEPDASGAGGDDASFANTPPKDGMIASSTIAFPTPGPPSDLRLSSGGQVFCAGMLAFCTFEKDSLEKTLDKNLVNDATSMQYIFRAAISPDGKTLVTAPGGVLMMSSPGPPVMKVWEAGSGALLHASSAHPRPITAAQATNDHIITGCADGKVRVFSIATAEVIREMDVHDATHGIGAMELISDSLFVTGGYDNCIKLCNIETGTVLQTRNNIFTTEATGAPNEHTAIFVSASPRKDVVVTVGQYNQPIKAFRASDLSLIHAFEDDSDMFAACAVLSDSTHVAMAGAQGIHVFNLRTGDKIRVVESPGATALVATRDMCVVAADGADRIALWGIAVSPDAEAAEAPKSSLELGESVTMMCAGPASHDSVVVLGNQEPGLEVSAADGKAIRQFKPEEYGGFAGIRAWTAYCACFGSGQLALGYDKDVSVADIGQSSIDTVGKSTVAANVLCMAAVGEDRMAFGLENGSIALVDNKGTVVSTIKQAHQKKVNHVTSYDDTTIVSVGEDHHLRVWDITKPSKAKKEVEIKSEMELYHPTHGILLDDKKAIVTVQSIIRVFDLDSQETIAQEKFCQQTLIGSVVLSPDKTHVATNSYNGRLVVIWSVPDLKPVLTVQLDQDVSHLCYLPSGSLAVAGGKDGRISILKRTDVPSFGVSAWFTRPDPYSQNKEETGPATIASQDKPLELQFKEAANASDLARCQELLDEGVDVNTCDMEYKMNTLMAVCSQGLDKVVRWLLSKGADVAPQDFSGYSALAHACMQGHIECAKMLLDAGADPNVISNTGISILWLTVSTRKYEIVPLLVERGADCSCVCHRLSPLALMDTVPVDDRTPAFEMARKVVENR